MRPLVAIVPVAALVGLVVLATPASASHCGACNYPPCAAPQEQCCPPVVQHRICYQTIVEDQPVDLLSAGLPDRNEGMPLHHLQAGLRAVTRGSTATRSTAR